MRPGPWIARSVIGANLVLLASCAGAPAPGTSLPTFPESSAQSASAIRPPPATTASSRRLHADPPRGRARRGFGHAVGQRRRPHRPSACPRRRSAASNAWTARTAAPQRRARTAASGCSRSTPPPTRHPPPPVRSGSSTPRARTERTTTRPSAVRPGCSSSVPKRRCSPSNTGRHRHDRAAEPVRCRRGAHPASHARRPRAAGAADDASVALSPTPTPTAPPGPVGQSADRPPVAWSRAASRAHRGHRVGQVDGRRAGWSSAVPCSSTPT